MKHKNFYETVKEANNRLRNTVIWYNGPGEQGPYSVMIITDHDGADYKIYMKKLGQKKNNLPGVMCPSDHLSSGEGSDAGKHMDKFMKDYPEYGLVRKDLSSPHFQAFRPFPLGMMNLVTKNKEGKPVDCETLFLERQPLRPATQQGLTAQMIYTSYVNAAMSRPPTQVPYQFDIWTDHFYDCLMGLYPSIDTCLTKMTDPKIANEAAAFHRYFALVKGPIGMLYLSYKADIVGVLDNKNLTSLTVDREYRYTREVISDLQMFSNIKM